MSEYLGEILLGLAALLSVAIGFFIAMKVINGHLIPIPVRELVETLQENHTELVEQNRILKEERETDKRELKELTNRSIETETKMITWLNRYENLGGFISPLNEDLIGKDK